jgi:mono/diheme cytochrome c family protein
MRRWIIGLSTVFVLVLGVCALYATHMVKDGFSTRTAPSGMETVMATSMRDMAVPARYKTMKNPVAVTPEVIHEGLAHYADHCAVCHANNGSGDSMLGKGMYPRPPNLAGQETQSMSDGEIYYPIVYGIRLSGMPAFGDASDEDEESWKLVSFIRHLPQLTVAEQTEMESLNPKSPEEFKEEQEEAQFLNGGDSSAANATPHHPKGKKR